MPKTAKLNSHEIIDALKSQNLIAAKYSSFTVTNYSQAINLLTMIIDDTVKYYKCYTSSSD